MGAFTEFDPHIHELRLAAPVIETRLYPRVFRAPRALEAVERGLALGLLILMLPLLVLAAVLVAGLSRKCPLVAHPRVGQGGREITVLKLRTMWGSLGEERHRRWLFIEPLRKVPAVEFKTDEDPRVTSTVAAFFRRHSIDELPQLWHVVHGDMALVGPRPIMASELLEHYGPAAIEVLRVKPGLTGLWQVRGRSALTYRQRRRLDLFLVRRWSFRLYCFILLATVPKVLMGKDAC